MRSNKRQLAQQKAGPLFQMNAHNEKQDCSIELTCELGLSREEVQQLKKQLSRN
ncbi:hypothetical protein [Halalkalibacter hemicellulosilyticus]|uniref:Uncharacterized protein n=1 Tax=Halalkalibacter hemicellulosilyticusJCM 9152 TaxID=1236971 RepID=W4QFN6_9BACI|nr:hypothetical protein [Halalkalibacter hemicellulosilyticus]GAE30443.1 hypothetical protein JCM9152_1851 [Halalkalibacter hemicellulosilyticusJCM 9152]